VDCDPHEPVAERRVGGEWLSLYRARADSLHVVRHDGDYDKRAHVAGEYDGEADYYGFDFLADSEERVAYWTWETGEEPYPTPTAKPAAAVPEDVRSFLAANGYDVVDAERMLRGGEYVFVER